MKTNNQNYSFSNYNFNEQNNIYSLYEETRNWRNFIKQHITDSKEEIMGKDINGKLISINTAQTNILSEIKNSTNTLNENINNSKTAINNEIINSENNIKEDNKNNTSLILNAINELKTWWSTFKPTWA